MSVTTKIISSPRMHHMSAALLTAFLLSTAPASAQVNTVRRGGIDLPGIGKCRPPGWIAPASSLSVQIGERPDPELHRHHWPPRVRYRLYCRRRDGVGGAGEHAHHSVWRVGGRIRRRQRRHFGRSRRRRQPPDRRHAQIGFAAAVVGGRAGRRQSRTRRRSHETQASQLIA